MRRIAALLALAALAWSGAVVARPLLAITIDDLPAHGPLPAGADKVAVAEAIVAALARERVPATGFVNAAGIDAAGGEVIARWRAAGHPVGNHGWSHRDLDAVGATAFIADVARDEPVLAAAMPQGGWRWLRFPFLHEGAVPADRAAVRGWLAAHGYRIAPVTMNFADYLWTAPYARCVATGDAGAIRRMERAFLSAAAADGRAARARGGAQVLLVHIGAFDARMMPRLLATYRRLGFAFGTLEQAARDPVVAALADPAGPPAPPPVTIGPGAATQAWLDGLCRGGAVPQPVRSDK